MDELKQIKLDYKGEIKEINFPNSFSQLKNSFLLAYGKEENLSFYFKNQNKNNNIIFIKENENEYKDSINELIAQQDKIIYVEDNDLSSENLNINSSQNNFKEKNSEIFNNNSGINNLDVIELNVNVHNEDNKKISIEESNNKTLNTKKDKKLEINKEVIREEKKDKNEEEEKKIYYSDSLAIDNKEIEQMKKKIKDLEEDLANKKFENQKLEKKNGELLLIKENLEKESRNLIKKYDDQLKDLDLKYNTKEEENANLLKKLKEMEKHKKELEDKIKNQKDKYEGEISSLKEKNKEEIEVFKSKMNEKNNEINLLSNKYEKEISLLKKKRKEEEEFTKKLNEKDNEMNMLKNKINNYEKENKLAQKNQREEIEKSKIDIENKYKNKIDEYEKTISQLKKNQISICTTEHKKIKCEKCHKEPIVGYRYKCFQCKNYNLCQECELENSINNDHPHNFIKIKNALIDDDNNMINYSYECLNKKLQTFIRQGTSDTKISIVIKNNNLNKWPQNKTFLMIDNNKFKIDCDKIALRSLSNGEQDIYVVHFKNLSQLTPQEYKVYMNFIVDGKKYGEPLCLTIIIINKRNNDNNEDIIKQFKNKYKFKEGMFTDEKILSKLKENNNDFESTFFRLYFS